MSECVYVCAIISLPQKVVDQESAFKAKLGLCDDFTASTLSLATTTTPSKMPVTNDTITRYTNNCFHLS